MSALTKATRVFEANVQLNNEEAVRARPKRDKLETISLKITREKRSGIYRLAYTRCLCFTIFAVNGGAT